MVMGCNSGGVGGEGTGGGEGRGLSGAMMEVGRSAERAFYSFIELMSDVLGFTAKVDTKKSDVGNYFNSLGIKLGEATKELEEVAKKSEVGVGKGEESKDGKNAIREAIDQAKGVLGKLKGHLESLKGIGDDKVVGYANNAQGIGTAPDDVQLKTILGVLKDIMKIATDVGGKALEVGVTTLTVNGVDNKDGAKILATSGASNPGANDAGKAAIILASVTGKEMLDSIVKS
ncbi:Borrelia lipoprotein-containing protein (plasmid) [Borrelia crocidurae str. Achema]|uniref:Variable large protein n=1 Tax=Borrelia crocidurae (strain Achema) TaxID=1155096 RepID=I0FEM1_BORCA|nr:Borrelia lipoprotein-containing protein [Borrelia crocidurae str. Achema]